jgi:peptidoglycan/LPS O-acetylase OafA/YrhL
MDVDVSPVRSRPLDALRALAVLLVIGRHVAFATESPYEAFSPWMRAWIRGGWIGVDLFFVLSGYLVSGLVFREHRRTGGFRPLVFLGRRGFKLYPGFWLLIAVTCGLVAALGERVSLQRVLVELCFLQGYAQGIWSHTWSLAVEEHFYVLLAVGLWWTVAKGSVADRARPFGWVPVVAVLVALLAFAARVHLLLRGARPVDLLYPTHLRLDALLFGALLAHWAHDAPGAGLERVVRARPWACALAAVLLLGLPFVLDFGDRLGGVVLATIGLPLLSLGSGLLLLLAVRAGSPETRVGAALLRGVAWVGAHSYSIYLWHGLVGILNRLAFARWWPERPLEVEAGAYIAGSVVVGILLGKLVEAPALRLRDRWLPSRSGALSPAGR